MIVPHRPSLREKVFFFISGIILSVPLTLLVESLSSGYFLDIGLPELYATVLSVAIIAPLVEEFAKAYPMFYRHGETERSIFTLGFLVGLGFGFSEFLIYVIGLGVPVVVRLPGIFFHAAGTSITCYGIATKHSLRFYLLAVSLHFLNNLFALLAQPWLLGLVAVICATYFLSIHFYRKTSEKIVV